MQEKATNGHITDPGDVKESTEIPGRRKILLRNLAGQMGASVFLGVVSILITTVNKTVLTSYKWVDKHDDRWNRDIKLWLQWGVILDQKWSINLSTGQITLVLLFCFVNTKQQH